MTFISFLFNSFSKLTRSQLIWITANFCYENKKEFSDPSPLVFLNLLGMPWKTTLLLMMIGIVVQLHNPGVAGKTVILYIEFIARPTKQSTSFT